MAGEGCTWTRPRIRPRTRACRSASVGPTEAENTPGRGGAERRLGTAGLLKEDMASLRQPMAVMDAVGPVRPEPPFLGERAYI